MYVFLLRVPTPWGCVRVVPAASASVPLQPHCMRRVCHRSSGYSSARAHPAAAWRLPVQPRRTGRDGEGHHTLQGSRRQARRSVSHPSSDFTLGMLRKMFCAPLQRVSLCCFCGASNCVRPVLLFLTSPPVCLSLIDRDTRFSATDSYRSAWQLYAPHVSFSRLVRLAL